MKLQSHIGQINEVWSGYEDRFAKVDKDLGAAADRFAKEVAEQQKTVSDFTRLIDKGCAEAVQRLQSAVSSFNDNTTELIEGFEGVEKAFKDFRMPRGA